MRYTQEEIFKKIAQVAEDLSKCSDVDTCDMHEKQWLLLKAYCDRHMYIPEVSLPLSEQWFDGAYRGLVDRSMNPFEFLDALDPDKQIKIAKNTARACLDAFKTLQEISDFFFGKHEEIEEDQDGFTMPASYET